MDTQKEMVDKLSFLTSRKFYALVAIAILGVLKGMGALGADIADPLMTFLYGFIGVNLVVKAVDSI